MPLVAVGKAAVKLTVACSVSVGLCSSLHTTPLVLNSLHVHVHVMHLIVDPRMCFQTCNNVMHQAHSGPMPQPLATVAVQGNLKLPIIAQVLPVVLSSLPFQHSGEATEALRPGPSDGADGRFQ